jgi:hypothetical protein
MEDLHTTKQSVTLVTQCLLPHLDSTACLPWLVVLKIRTNTVHCVEKYSVQKLNIELNRNYSYTIHLYGILHGGNTVESFIGSILTVQSRVKQ